jgi:uncharacterized membrane protein YfcA
MAVQHETLAGLFLVACIAGFIDTLAGGGGLLTIPALLLAPLPPIQALATNKFQGSFGTLTATLTLLAKGQVRFKEVAGLFVPALLGAAFGALAIQSIDSHAMDAVIPLILTGIAVYFLLAPKAGDIDRKPRLPEAPYRRLVIPVIAFYDGFFGPGTGSFYSLAGVALRGQNLVSATAFAKVLNFASNISGLFIFVWSGKVVWIIGAVMAIGQMIGAYAGSLAIIGGGARLIRPLIVAVCFALLARYAWQKGLLPI